MNTWKKEKKNPQDEDVFEIQKEGKVVQYIVMIDLERELQRAKDKVTELENDIKECGKL